MVAFCCSFFLSINPVVGLLNRRPFEEMDAITEQQNVRSRAIINLGVKWPKVFISSAGCILLLTGLAKIVSILGNAALLDEKDPIIGISFRHLMLLAGIIELAIAAICFLAITVKSHWNRLSAWLVVWFGLTVSGYRLCLVMIGYVRPCKCMGNLLDAIHLPPATVDILMKTLLGYLLIGGGITLILLLNRQRKFARSPQLI